MNVVIALQRVCAGGGHATLSVTIDGELYGNREFDTEELRGNLSREEKEILVGLLVRVSTAGLTKAQTRNRLQAGLNYTL